MAVGGAVKTSWIDDLRQGWRAAAQRNNEKRNEGVVGRSGCFRRMSRLLGCWRGF